MKKLSITEVEIFNATRRLGPTKGKVTFSDGKSYDFHVGPRDIYIRFYFFESRSGASFAHGFFSLRRERLLQAWLTDNGKTVFSIGKSWPSVPEC